jgi:hypothetical protein
MTSVSAAPAPGSGGVEKAAQAKRGGVDYSKFDNIVDSDDEKPAAKSTDASKKASPAEKPHCHNCMKDIDKPLRCGICKKVSYCSQECQKSDWSFHKRNCKKPEEPKPKSSPQEKTAKKEASAEKKKRAEDEKIVDDENEDITWYRHREWKPTCEPKKEFKPAQINDSTPGAVVRKETGDGAAWNAAGTWEDKDVTELAQRTLRAKLQGAPLPSVEAAGGVVAVEEIDQVEGDASKPVIQKKRRHLFDLGFKVKLVFKWMDSDGQKKAEGTLQIRDFTNDAFSEDGDNAPVMELTFKDRSIDAARRNAVDDSIGARSWPPPAGSLSALLVARMRAWMEEYQAMG